MNPLITPRFDLKPEDERGFFVLAWYKFWDAITTLANYLLVSVTDLLGRDYVYGGSNLTNAGKVPIVSTTDATLQESAVTDDGTNVYTTARNFIVGAAAAISTAAGRVYSAVKGVTDAGVFEASSAVADADATSIGEFQVADSHGTNAEKRLAVIQVVTDGATATKRGGRIYIGTKANNGAFTFWLCLDRAGNFGTGGNLTPAYAVDVTGEIRSDTAFRVGANKVVGARGAALTGTAGAGNAAGVGYLQADAATWVTLMNNLRTRVSELEARLQAHGLIS